MELGTVLKSSVLLVTGVKLLFLFNVIVL
jgi:hypothetical protein